MYQIGYAKYINYITLTIDPFLGPCYCLSIADRLPIAHVLGPLCRAPGGWPPGPSDGRTAPRPLHMGRGRARARPISIGHR